jgi:hypothetical protein
MLLPSLRLMRDRMDVAEAALEQVRFEDRGRISIRCSSVIWRFRSTFPVISFSEPSK